MASLFRSIRLEAAAAIGLMILVAVRVLVAFDLKPMWDLTAADNVVDRMRFDHVAAGICDGLFVLLLWVVLVARLICRRGVYGWAIGAWAIGSGFALYHGWDNAADFRFGSVWIGALSAGLTAMHLADHFKLRRLLMVSCAMLVLPLGLNAVHQITIQHQRDIEHYEQNKKQVLAEHGWEPGSAEQRKFQTRLYQNEATGAFGLANVFGSAAMGLMFLAGGVAMAAWRGGVAKSVKWTCAAVAVLGAATAALSVSKGVAAAAGIAFIAVAATWRLNRKRPDAMRWIAVSLFVVSLGGIAVLWRVALLGIPPTDQGERSLLFRYMYWDGAARMLYHNDPVLGVGPGQFQRQFQQHKQPYTVDGAPAGQAVCPEDVIDPHNVFVAYLATLGVGGLAWGAILIGWLVRAARNAADAWSEDSPAAVAAPPRSQSQWLIPGAIGAGWYAVVFFKHGPMMTVDNAIILAVSVALFVLLTGKLLQSALDERWMALGAWGAAAGILLHNQIEMAMTHVMAATLMMVILGAAAGSAKQSMPKARRWPAAIPGLAACIVLVLMGRGVTLQHYQRYLVSQCRGDTARWIPVENILQQTAAIRELNATWYDSHLYFQASVWDFSRSLSLLKDKDGMGMMRQWLKSTRNVAEERDDPRVWKLLAGIHSQNLDAEHDRQAAFHALKMLLRCTRYDIGQHLYAADTAWAMGDRGMARRWYERALILEKLNYLDPNSAMRAQDRRRAQRRLESAG